MRRKVVFVVFVLSLCCLFNGLWAQKRLNRKDAAEIDKIFSVYNNSTPGVAVAVVKGGDIVYKRGFGMSNLEHDIPIKTTSVFHIASISKQFTTMSILLLEKEGKLSLDENIRKYIPEVPDFGETITIRHLAHHTSGLRDQWSLLDLAGWRREDLKTQEDVLDLVSRQKELNFKPGEEYLYSNTGFTLLAIIVDRVSGISLREFADKNIFKPLGMNNTHFHNDMMEIVKGRTQAYYPGSKGTFRISIPNFNTYGATSLFTTVEDLALWSQNITHMKVGGKDVLDKLLLRGVLNSGKTIDYAFGISHGKYKGISTLGHGGADAGYRADFQMFPDQDLSIIIFANLGITNPSRMVRQVADIVLKDDFPEAPPSKPKAPQKKERIKRPKLIPDQLLQYVGTYYSEELDTKFVVEQKENRLYLKRRKFRNVRMLARDEDIFYSSGDQYKFQRDKNNRVSGFTVTTGRVRNLKFVRLEKK